MSLKDRSLSKWVMLGIGLTAVFCLIGCEDKAAYVPVDFTKKSIQSAPQDQARGEIPVLKVAIAAMISPKETFSSYFKLVEYVGKKMNHNIQLIQRKTYAEINLLFQKGDVDLAFICTGPYAAGRDKYGFEAIATPIVQGEPYYHAYLIVHIDNSAIKIEDLKGQVFAFTDPDSNTGALIPIYWLYQMNETPESFFSRIHYTYSHDNSILAVSKSLVDGASVDSHIWEYYRAHNPELTAKTKIIRKSAPFGSPPFVVSRTLPPASRNRIRSILIEMHEYEEGRKILEPLMIDRFEPTQEDWYQAVRDIKQRVEAVKDEE